MQIRQIAKDAQARTIQALEEGETAPLIVGLAKGEGALHDKFLPLVRQAKAKAEDMELVEELDAESLRDMLINDVATTMQVRILRAAIEHANGQEQA